jgi:hypothetical protein
MLRWIDELESGCFVFLLMITKMNWLWSAVALFAVGIPKLFNIIQFSRHESQCA